MFLLICEDTFALLLIYELTDKCISPPKKPAICYWDRVCVNIIGILCELLFLILCLFYLKYRIMFVGIMLYFFLNE